MHSTFTAFISMTSVAAASAAAFTKNLPQSENSMKVKAMSELIHNARPVRKLEDGGDDDAYAYSRDLSGYSLKFDKCQFIKAYDDDLAAYGYSDSVLSVRSFVTFKICPEASCGNSYSSGCGEYVIDMSSYLTYVGAYYQADIGNTCDACDANCEVDDVYGYNKYANGNRRLEDGGSDCSSCLPMCYQYEYFGENGSVDAMDYAECVAVNANDEGTQLYVGPSCVSNGHKVKIAVYEDQYCSVLSDTNIETAVGYKVSDLVLGKVYSKKCVSCNYGNDDDGGNGVDICGNLYPYAAKCEEDMDYSELSNNEAANEGAVCGFIDIIESGTYDQTGEIYLGEGVVTRVSGGIEASGPQKFFLTFFLLASLALGAYSYVLFGLVKRKSKVNLSSQEVGGTLA